MTEDHPRLRGEHDKKYIDDADAVGSPPPTRGTPKNVKETFEKIRITPAYAGNTV